ncbi:MAG: hypothetical protein WDO13_07460 [Verrucomicrobiota bacterium]
MKHLSEVRFGFIGAGQIAYYAADAVLSHPHARLVAIQDLSVDRLKQLQKRHFARIRAREGRGPACQPDDRRRLHRRANKFHVPLAIQALEARQARHPRKAFAMNAQGGGAGHRRGGGKPGWCSTSA